MGGGGGGVAVIGPNNKIKGEYPQTSRYAPSVVICVLVGGVVYVTLHRECETLHPIILHSLINFIGAKRGGFIVQIKMCYSSVLNLQPFCLIQVANTFCTSIVRSTPNSAHLQLFHIHPNCLTRYSQHKTHILTNCSTSSQK